MVQKKCSIYKYRIIQNWFKLYSVHGVNGSYAKIRQIVGNSVDDSSAFATWNSNTFSNFNSMYLLIVEDLVVL